MPKFDAMYPDAGEWKDIACPGVGTIWKAKDGATASCCGCGEPARWVETCAESFMCSTECSKAFWNRLEEACSRMPGVTCEDMEIDF